MEFWGKIKNAGKAVAAVFQKEPVTEAVSKPVKEPVKVEREGVDTQTIINDNMNNGCTVKMKLEELRHKVNAEANQGYMNGEVISKINDSIKKIQDKLDSACDVLIDVSEMDEAALELIEIMSEYLGQNNLEIWMKGLESLKMNIGQERYMNDRRRATIGMFQLKYSQLEAQKEATLKRIDQTNKSLDEIDESIRRARAAKVNYSGLRVIQRNMEGTVEIDTGKVNVFDEAMTRIAAQIKQLETMTVDMDMKELNDKMAEIEEKEREDYKKQAETLRELEMENLKAAEEAALWLEEVRRILPSSTVENLDVVQGQINDVKNTEKQENSDSQLLN